MARPHASYRVIVDAADRLVIEDIGHDKGHPSITNDAEWVVEQVAPALDGRALLYIDSMGRTDRLLVKDGRFAGFALG